MGYIIKCENHNNEYVYHRNEHVLTNEQIANEVWDYLSRAGLDLDSIHSIYVVDDFTPASNSQDNIVYSPSQEYEFWISRAREKNVNNIITEPIKKIFREWISQNESEVERDRSIGKIAIVIAIIFLVLVAFCAFLPSGTALKIAPYITVAIVVVSIISIYLNSKS